jgi:hypothetical protein
MDFEVLAEGLLFPEGPIAMPDGSVVLVEIARGALTRVWGSTASPWKQPATCVRQRCSTAA